MGLFRKVPVVEPGEAGPPEARVDAGVATTAGPRAENQDRCAATPRWGLVSDGVGGHAGGGRAADLTVEAVVAVLEATEGPFDERTLRVAARTANDAVRAGRAADVTVATMGATLVAAALVAAGPDGSRWLVAHLGDSPAWHVAADAAVQVTEDHTLVAEMRRAGALTPEEAVNHPARHVIARSIGGDETATPDVSPVVLAPRDGLVLASDGVSDVLDAADVHRVVAAAPTASAAAAALVDASLAAGTGDNVTAVVLRHLAPSGDDHATD